MSHGYGPKFIELLCRYYPELVSFRGGQQARSDNPNDKVGYTRSNALMTNFSALARFGVQKCTTITKILLDHGAEINDRIQIEIGGSKSDTTLLGFAVYQADDPKTATSTLPLDYFKLLLDRWIGVLM